MTSTLPVLRRSALILPLLLGNACGSSPPPARPDGPATVALKRLVAENPEVKRLLVASIEQAKRVNPDPRTNPAQSLERYFDFVAMAERGMPGRLIEPKPGATLYQSMDQSLGCFYFVCDQRLAELAGRGYFNDSLQYLEPFGAWLTTFNRAWGAYLDTPESWDNAALRLAQADPVFGLDRGWYEDPSHWTTFNQFFARRLQSADQRPIAARDDESVVASPVDAVPQGVWAIDASSHLVAAGGVPVKTGTVVSVDALLGEQSQHKGAFAGGTFTHLFLDVGDYHHYHFPLGGVVKEVAVIPGHGVTGGVIAWDAARGRYTFDPSSVGWQSLETRGLVILETRDHGLVALLPIGMACVSSVNFDPAIKEGAVVGKGDAMGHFLFGGSDFIMLFQAGHEFVPDAPANVARGGSGHKLMGERLGVVNERPTANPAHP